MAVSGYTETAKRSGSSNILSRYYSSRFGLPLTLAVIIILVWELGARRVSPLLLTPLSKIIQAWAEIISNGVLLNALAISLQSVFIGLGIAIIVGVGIGMLMARYRPIEYFLNIYITFLLTTPMIAIIPVVVIFVGFTLTSRIIVVFLFSWIYILVNTFAGVRGTDPALLEMARSFGAKERHMFLKVILPSAMPAIMAGLRIGSARAVLGMLVSELLLATVGLGDLMIQYENSFNNSYLFAVIFTIIVLGLIIVGFVAAIEKRVLSWRQAATLD